MSAVILFGSMALMIGFGIPIAIVLGVSSALTLLFSGAPLGVIPSMMQATVQKFSLLTIPLFVLAGAIMDKGGISKRLINLADSIIGPVFCSHIRFRHSNRCSHGIHPDSRHGETGI